MSNFKVGDKVRCIEGFEGRLEVGQIYTVTAIATDVAVEWLHFSGKPGGGWLPERFVLVEPEPVEPAPARNQALTVSNTLPLDAVREEWVKHASQILARGGVNLQGHARGGKVKAVDVSVPNGQDSITRSEHQTRWGLMRVEFNWRSQLATFTLDPAEDVKTLDPTITRVHTDELAWGGRQVHDTNTAAAVAACMVSGKHLEPNGLTADRARTARTQEQAAAEATRLPGPGTDAEWGEP